MMTTALAVVGVIALLAGAAYVGLYVVFPAIVYFGLFRRKP